MSTTSSRLSGALLLAAALASATAAAQAQAPAAPAAVQTPIAPAVNLSEGYVLGPGDIVEVAVIGRDEYKARVQVQVDGSIQLPYINSIPAANRTVLQLRDDVAARLKSGGFYNNPAVSVIVATYASRYVVVLGEVASPGIVPVDRSYRVSELLARVGGTRATGADILTLRRATGEELQLPIEKVAMGGAADDPIINPGDKLYVGAAPTYYIYGQVNGAGTFRIAPGMTLRQAIAQGGGLTDRGSEKKIKVFRGGQSLETVDLSTLIKGGDVIVVGERFF